MGQDVDGALAESDGSRNLLNGMSDKNFHIQSNKICLLIQQIAINLYHNLVWALNNIICFKFNRNLYNYNINIIKIIDDAITLKK